MSWEFDTNLPIYQGLVAKIEQLVLSGEYKPGQQLPPVRELAVLAGVNPNTAQRAYAELETSGLIDNQRTTGRFVTNNESLIEERRIAAAKKHVGTYFSQMGATGYNKENAVDFLIKNK